MYYNVRLKHLTDFSVTAALVYTEWAFCINRQLAFLQLDMRLLSANWFIQLSINVIGHTHTLTAVRHYISLSLHGFLPAASTLFQLHSCHQSSSLDSWVFCFLNDLSLQLIGSLLLRVSYWITAELLVPLLGTTTVFSFLFSPNSIQFWYWSDQTLNMLSWKNRPHDFVFSTAISYLTSQWNPLFRCMVWCLFNVFSTIFLGLALAGDLIFLLMLLFFSLLCIQEKQVWPAELLPFK